MPHPLTFVLTCTAAVLVALVAGCAAPAPRPEREAPDRQDLAREEQRAVGQGLWLLRMEDALGVSNVRSPADQADLKRSALSRPETALVAGTAGGSEGVPPHYRYSFETQTLSVYVNAFALPPEGTNRYIPYEPLPKGTCVAGLPRSFEFGKVGAVLASFALMDVQFPCAQGTRLLFSGEVSVPASEMGKVFPRLAWELDVTPVASENGRLNGARVLKLPEGPTWYLTATRVRLHEMRLVDPATGKVYFKAGPAR